MSVIELKNDKISAALKTMGAELTSLKDTEGTEYLWQGNPDYWSGQAPVLFPIIGCLRNGTASVSGDKTCSFGRHGIARRKEFTLISSTEDKAVFSLKADEETKKQYPFDFELQMTYELDGQNLRLPILSSTMILFRCRFVSADILLLTARFPRVKISKTMWWNSNIRKPLTARFLMKMP